MTKFYAAVREISPSLDQIQTLQRHVGSVRFAQNWCLDYAKLQLETGNKQSWSSISLHSAWREHREKVAPWYTEVSKESFQYGCERASKGLINFVKNRKHFKFPKIRKRGRNDSVCYTSFSLKSSVLVHIPRVGKILFKEEFILSEGSRITAVLVREKAGRWFATFKLRDDSWTEPEKKEIRTVVGVDAGVADTFAVLSDGIKVENPRFFRQAQRKLSYLSKALKRLPESCYT